MANVTFKRGKSYHLSSLPLKSGQISFTTDDGRIHLDYIDEHDELKRRTFYSGKLTIGKYVYDGTSDVTVDNYNGDYDNI